MYEVLQLILQGNIEGKEAQDYVVKKKNTKNFGHKTLSLPHRECW